MATPRQQELAFQSWLARKEDEQRIKIKQEKMQKTMQEEMELQRLARGKEAYQQWMKKIKQLDELHRKDAIRKKQLKKLMEEDSEKRLQQSQQEYEHWKQKKDQEKSFQLKNDESLANLTSHLPSARRATTPTLPGYISVWACDQETANVMISNVSRPLSCTLLQPI